MQARNFHIQYLLRRFNRNLTLQVDKCAFGVKFFPKFGKRNIQRLCNFFELSDRNLNVLRDNPERFSGHTRCQQRTVPVINLTAHRGHFDRALETHRPLFLQKFRIKAELQPADSDAKRSKAQKQHEIYKLASARFDFQAQEVLNAVIVTAFFFRRHEDIVPCVSEPLPDSHFWAPEEAAFLSRIITRSFSAGARPPSLARTST